ncbi:hypothetical protein UPYG_G00076660 [Umbra pygmaea]|uniref:Uncharacterized protein n=1 Tax=Umbra pygmaea TaxID=75934 RepID=A0ABD0XCV1_UMBPY
MSPCCSHKFPISPHSIKAPQQQYYRAPAINTRSSSPAPPMHLEMRATWTCTQGPVFEMPANSLYGARLCHQAHTILHLHHTVTSSGLLQTHHPLLTSKINKLNCYSPCRLLLLGSSLVYP